MTPALAMTIEAARDLAWRPTANLGGRGASHYEPRLESHRRVVDSLAGVTGLSANASPELRFLLAAIRRVAACSFSNRMGHPYYERKQAVAELRGCLVVYDQLSAPRPGRDFVGQGSRPLPRSHGRLEAPRAQAPRVTTVTQPTPVSPRGHVGDGHVVLSGAAP